MSVEVILGDCLDVLRGMDEASVDSVVTDPPYGLEFMGREWDAPWKHGFAKSGLSGERLPGPIFGSKRNPVCRSCKKHKRGKDACCCEARDFDETPADSSRAFGQWCEAWAREVYRVMKPGAHLVAFGGTRTWHRLACAIEDAGFEIRDSVGYLFDGGLPGPLVWAYGTGFPKSLNVSRALDDHRCLCHLCDASSISATVAARSVLQPNVRGTGEAEAASPQDMHGLRGGVDADHERAARPQSDVLASVQRSPHLAEQGRANPRASHDALRHLREDASPLALQAEETDGGLLLAELPGQGARGSAPAVQRQHEGAQEKEPQARRGEPGLEGRRHVPQPEGQLRLGSLREVPAGASEHGPNGRVRDGAPAGDGAVDRQATPAGRVRASRGSRPSEQPSIKPDALAGQPQSQDGGAWPHCGRCGKPIVPDGLGTALKPSFEPIVLARKPLACPTVAAQVLATGTGALNIGATRVAHASAGDLADSLSKNPGRDDVVTSGVYGANRPQQSVNTAGRWPANLVHDGSPEVLEAFAAFGSSKSPSTPVRQGGKNIRGFDVGGGSGPDREGFGVGYGDEGSPARFFYSAKASKADRCGSRHPTIKPVALMRWLCRLVTPPGGVCLDPFAGSGTTGEACLREGFNAVLIEREAEYVEDCRRRLARHRAEAPLLAEVAA